MAWLWQVIEALLPLIIALLAAGALVTFVAVSALVFIWMERKVAGRMQDRLGPTRVGGKFGWLQTLADGVKLLVKEDTIPAEADGFLFRMAPYIAFCGAFVAFVALPFGNGLVAQEISVAVFFMLAVMSSEVFGVILAGYGSASKWSLFGGIREAAQVVSYEVPRAMCVLLPVILAGSLSLNEITNKQAGSLLNWYVFNNPFSFVACFVFFICGTASCKRAPFDLAEAESELVAGFHTEYSGLRWSLFFMAEYGSMFAVAAIAVTLFCGGWHTGFLWFEPTDYFGFWLGNLFNAAVFITKGYIGVFVMMWVRWTLPRLRIDQVMTTCLKYLLPISCFLFLGQVLWMLLVSPELKGLTRYV
ncbi:MAG: NADH-quinone oxidoreductase subunit NuoH, partial [Gemmataceae bacterium]|nr:NADH-quinone oxidoreductase subunit NuoH [Gemmataceae bacterium]